MGRATELRDLADRVEAHERITDAHAAALAAYRADPTEDNRVAYREAVKALTDDREQIRLAEGRVPGTGPRVGGDAFVVTPDPTTEG